MYKKQKKQKNKKTKTKKKQKIETIKNITYTLIIVINGFCVSELCMRCLEHTF